MKSEDFFIFGYFGFVTDQLDGQTIKTRSVKQLFDSKLGYLINYYDTELIKSNKFSLFSAIFHLIRCKRLIYLPAQNNLKLFFPFLFILSRIFRIDIYYFVVGGWLPDFIKKNNLACKLNKISHIYTETSRMKAMLENEFGFSNVSEFPNFRIHNYKPRINHSNSGLRIVFMSRIHRMKGIEMIIRYGTTTTQNVTIDFYGPINPEDKIYFEESIKNCSRINYKGSLSPDKIYSTLSNYDVLVLPTQYYTEGLPGAIVDAYIAGIPVIVTNWVHATEFVDHGITGFIIPFKNGYDEFKNCLDKLNCDPDLLLQLKRNSYTRSIGFSEIKAWEIIQNTILQN